MAEPKRLRARDILRAAAGIVLLMALAAPAAVAGEGLFTGGTFEYEVRRGESLTLLGARFGVSPAVLARDNGLDRDAWLLIGQVLRVNNRRIVPGQIPEGILINIPQRMLFLFRDGRLQKAYPVTVGRPDWPTPLGDATIVNKTMQPVWHVPASIRRELRRQGRPAHTHVPPGPQNPLGEYWIGISLSGIGLHSTNQPGSIFGFRSHGCIRLHPRDAAELYEAVHVGMAVRLVYEPVLLAESGEGVFLEVHPDIYDRGMDKPSALRARLEKAGVDDGIARAHARRLLAERDGIAVLLRREQEE